MLQRIGKAFANAAPVVSSNDSALRVPRVQSKFLNPNRGGGIITGIPAYLRKSHQDVQASWQPAAAHAVDIIQNSGFIAGMVDEYVTSMVGTGLQLRITPNQKFLRMETKQAWAWTTGIEERFNRWAAQPYQCDIEERVSFQKFQAIQCRQHLMFGETFTSLPWRKRYGSQYGTKFKMIPAYMMLDKRNGKDIIHGVKINDAGAALSYFFRANNALDDVSVQEIEIAKRDRFGRSQLIHNFDGIAGQVRGITPLAPIIQVIRQFDRLQDATLTAATLQTIFAATVKSTLPGADVLKAFAVPGEVDRQQSLVENYLDVSQAWNSNVSIDLGQHGKLAHLMPNEELMLNKSEHPNATYIDFAKYLLHEIARCLGLTFESATTDFSNATYASLTIGEDKNFNLFNMRRKHVIAPMCDDVLMAWLEEDILNGNTVFPGGHRGFLENRYEAFTSQWHGPGKTQADDLKSAKASEVLILNGLASHTEICEERGTDYDNVLQQIAREQAMREELGIREPVKNRVPDVEEQMQIDQGSNTNG